MTDFPHGAIAEHAFEEREHRELAPGINRIHDVAVAVGTMAAPDMCFAMLDVVDWIDEVLLPHAAWEEKWLYPEFDRRAGTPWATRVMAYEHHQIRDMARRVVADRERLRHEPTKADMVALRADMFSLEALLRAHIEREERFLLPLLMEEVPATPVAS
jgi:hemerythrin-like domain-containing protein